MAEWRRVTPAVAGE